ncbi:MAG: alpha-amylase family glycosyl hydrolase [Schleiferiaceae bacterium]|nr:alpha-amylase family glycosyl hydrolase [Schleiferiaceae bacterium]
MKKHLISLVLAFAINAQAQVVEKIEPASWWIGMEMNTVEFMVHGKDISQLVAESTTLEVIKSEGLESPNYLFVTATVPVDAKVGDHTLVFRNTKGKKVGRLSVALGLRADGSASRKGFSSADFIYLITPDRFRNGDASNDRVKGMLEGPNREYIGGRHGGDLAGVIKSLDYFEKMGISSLWLNPVLENNMETYSYHGYAMTDLYNVDPRYGTNEQYKELAHKAKEKGIGIIMDQVANHIGSLHPWMSDLPSEDWVNQWPEFTQTNHMKVSRFDPHAAEVDRKQFTDGWFVETMPDLNQRNEKLARYLIQNSIWWVEYLGLHGIRMDTWSYPDKQFLADWTKAILDEYPNFNIVGEEWVSDPSLISYWQAGTNKMDDYTSYLPSVMDFLLQSALIEGLNGESGWRSSMTKIYESLSNDYMYSDVNNIMIFPDNHDMSRVYTQLNEDFDKWKMAMTLFFTTRGTLQFYYGTEILMSNPGTSDHGVIRSDFPGGWKGDAVNAFTGEGLTAQQKEAQEYIRTLAHLRRQSCALNMGEMLHYIPLGEVYVYFRTFEQENIMVLANRNKEGKTIDLARFSQGLKGATSGENLITAEKVDLSRGTIEVGPMETLIFWVK